jgi:hypothetical protein
MHFKICMANVLKNVVVQIVFKIYMVKHLCYSFNREGLYVLKSVNVFIINFYMLQNILNSAVLTFQKEF